MEQPPVEIKLINDRRSLPHASFGDRNGRPCSLVESSVTNESIWLGLDGPADQRMHLTRAHVAALLPLLTRFVETGSLEEEGAK